MKRLMKKVLSVFGLTAALGLSALATANAETAEYSTIRTGASLLMYGKMCETVVEEREGYDWNILYEAVEGAIKDNPELAKARNEGVAGIRLLLISYYQSQVSGGASHEEAVRFACNELLGAEGMFAKMYRMKGDI